MLLDVLSFRQMLVKTAKNYYVIDHYRYTYVCLLGIH